MASQISIIGNGAVNLGAGEYKVISIVGSGGATTDIVSPVAGTVYSFAGDGAQEIFLSRDPSSQAVTQAVVSGFVSAFSITVEKTYSC